jgi:hypothetical protein
LFAGLRSGQVPNLAFIAPNPCDDQHGRDNAGPFCKYNPKDDGSQEGLNPALIRRGDMTLQNLVGAIKSSPVWRHGRNALVVVWNENDYSKGTERESDRPHCRHKLWRASPPKWRALHAFFSPQVSGERLSASVSEPCL